MGRPTLSADQRIESIFLGLDGIDQMRIVERLKELRLICERRDRVVKDAHMEDPGVDKPKRQRQAKPTKEKSFFAVEGASVPGAATNG